ncbi:MAG: rRNA maturation RNase YbeY [Actinomycetota bacterium]
MTVLVADEHSSDIDLDLIKAWAEAALTAEGYPPGVEVALTLVSDPRMAELHRRALGEELPTDVLSFPIEDLSPGRIPEVDPQGPPLLVGDIVLAPDYVRRQAAELGVQLEDELALLVTHGVLHLLGYDHQQDDEAQVMESREREILGSQGRERR